MIPSRHVSAVAITTDDATIVTVAGDGVGDVDFGGGARRALGGRDVFLTDRALDSGAHRCSSLIGSDGDDEVRALAGDSATLVVVGGYKGTPLRPAGTMLPIANGSDGFLLRLRR